MDFSTFRELKGWSLERAADELKANGDEKLARINASLVAKHEKGLHFPSPRVIARYAEITDKAVTYDDWERLRQSRETEHQAA